MIKYFTYMDKPAVNVLREHFDDLDDSDKAQRNAKIAQLDQEGILQGSVRDVIFRFYHTKWMLKKRWDAQKAKTQALDLAISAILKQAKGAPTDDGHQQEDGPVVFAIGLATFNSGVGPKSKHMVLLKKLVEKVMFAL